MNDLRVPMLVLEAELVCADGRPFEGDVFVPESASHHDGPPRVEEWLNETGAFFPFRPRDGSEPFLFNKREVLFLTLNVPAPPPPDESTDVPPTAVKRVEVEMETRRVSGVVYIDMPPSASRVLDYMNRPEAFMVLHDGNRIHVLQKERITRVIEIRG